jgi:hypothetical protein
MTEAEELLGECRDELRGIKTLLAMQLHAQHDDIGPGERDPISLAILLRAARGWTRAADLQAAVGDKAKSSTVGNRLSQLVSAGALERRGQAKATEYRATGLL